MQNLSIHAFVKGVIYIYIHSYALLGTLRYSIMDIFLNPLNIQSLHLEFKDQNYEIHDWCKNSFSQTNLISLL